MLPSILGRLKVTKNSAHRFMITRNKMARADAVQKLFVEKIREYKQKSGGVSLLDPSPDIIKELKKEHDRLFKVFGGGPDVDMTSFPTFKFVDPELDPIDEVAPEAKQQGKKKEKAKPEKKKK